MGENIRSDVLNEASGLINGQRQADYGTPQENFNCIAQMWSAYLGPEVSITAGDVCRMMTLLKIARLKNGPHHDSSVDGAGYMALGAEMDQTT